MFLARKILKFLFQLNSLQNKSVCFHMEVEAMKVIEKYDVSNVPDDSRPFQSQPRKTKALKGSP
jgi:hypothetical protein